MSKDWEFLEVLWENRMVTDAEDRYLKRIEDKEVVETKLGEKLLEEIAIPVSEVINKRQQQASETLLNNVGGGKRLPWVYLIPLADSQNGAFAVVQTLMTSLSTSKPPTYQHLAIEVGDTWARQIRFERWLEKESAYASKFLRQHRTALAGKARKVRFTRKLEKKIEGDWLLDFFHEGLKWLVEETVELPVPPKQGQLDIGTELKNAVYFFFVKKRQ